MPQVPGNSITDTLRPAFVRFRQILAITGTTIPLELDHAKLIRIHRHAVVELRESAR